MRRLRSYLHRPTTAEDGRRPEYQPPTDPNLDGLVVVEVEFWDTDQKTRTRQVCVGDQLNDDQVAAMLPYLLVNTYGERRLAKVRKWKRVPPTYDDGGLI